MVAVALVAGAATVGCPQPAYYGPPPIFPPPPGGECQSEVDCAAAHGPGWYCEKPGGAADPAMAWGVCVEAAEPPP
jgi:hypothetical protein